jgi:hypothetical protein
MYLSQDISPFAQVFSPQVVFTMSNGNVAVGIAGLQSKAQSKQEKQRQNVTVRLLSTPETLAPRTMCIDLVTIWTNNESTRSLLVIKRKQDDGLVTSIVEEEGHRRVSFPSPLLIC